MPSSYETFNGDGSTTDFTFTFDFISSSHVGVEVDGVATSAFSFIGTKQVRMDSAPASGTGNVVIRRTTPTAPLTDFVSGSTLSEGDLDRALLQSLYVSEEASDTLATVISFNGTTFDADSKRISNLGSPVAATDAVSKEYVDGISVAVGNVPTPLDPTDDDKVLTAGSGGFTWEAVPEELTAGSVGATELATDAVTSVKVQDAAITEAKLGSGAVTEAKLGSSAVATAKLADNAVTLAKMEHGTSGDVLYYGGSGQPGRLAKGTDGQVLTLASGLPSWSDSSGGWETVSGGTITPTAGVDNTVDFSGLDTDNYVHIVTYNNVGTTANTNYSLSARLKDGGTNQSSSNYDYSRFEIGVNTGNIGATSNSQANAAQLPTPDGAALYYDGGKVNGYQMFWMDADSGKAMCRANVVSMNLGAGSTRAHYSTLCINDRTWTDFDGIGFYLTGSTFSSGTFELKRKPIADLSGYELNWN